MPPPHHRVARIETSTPLSLGERAGVRAPPSTGFPPSHRLLFHLPRASGGGVAQRRRGSFFGSSTPHSYPKQTNILSTTEIPCTNPKNKYHLDRSPVYTRALSKGIQMRSLTPAFTIALASTALSASITSAQVADANYSVEHNFNYMPSGDVVQVTGSDYRHAWIRTTGIFGSVWAAESIAQDPLFDPFGTDSMGTASFATNSGLAMPVPCVYNTFNIPPAGINGFQCIILPLDQSFADACTEYFVAPYSPSPPFNIQGRIASSGGVHAVNARCYAFSSAGISVRGGIDMGNGRINWNPLITDFTAGGAQADGLHWKTDPVHLTANNLDTGLVIDATLFELEINSNSQGALNLSMGIFETDQTDLEFILTIPAAFVAPGEAGSVHLKVEHGIVTIADDTGAFDNILPLPGTPTPLIFPFPNDFDINYDLNLDPAFNWDVLTDLTGGAGTLADSICQADLNADGSLNFLDVSLFLQLFADQSPAADFNQDKSFNFLDVSAFLAAFAQGCNNGDPKPGL